MTNPAPVRAPSRPASLAQWLDYQLVVHPRSIELGLERVAEVWRRVGAPAPAPLVITIGGTNGKGSTVAFLEAMLAADGKRVGAFTSPHLLRYNERVRVAGRDVDDVTLVDAFERIEAARGADSAEPVALTYFEFGTLAALWIFAQAGLDVALLEVGLGGRLDAVNIIDADASIVTTVDLDHQDWLGEDRDSIGREKAGIFRAHRAAIVGECDPPRSLVARAHEIGADLQLAGRDFRFERVADGWQWTAGEHSLALPSPQLAAPVQLANASAAIASLFALRARVGWNPAAIAQGVRAARVGARLQRFGAGSGAAEPELFVDVAHNPQAARALAQWLQGQRKPAGVFAVFGALGDKDVRGVVESLAGDIDAWFLAGLERDSPRGLAATDLREMIGSATSGTAPMSIHADVAAALDAAFTHAQAGDRVLAFGSFFVAAAALTFAHQRGLRGP